MSTQDLVAARIAAKRAERGWTLTQLSAEVERSTDGSLSAALLGRIENGNRALSLAELDLIATALEVEVDWLTRAGQLCGSCGQEITR